MEEEVGSQTVSERPLKSILVWSLQVKTLKMVMTHATPRKGEIITVQTQRVHLLHHV